MKQNEICSKAECLWSFSDVAYFLKQSENTVRKNTALGIIPHVKLGKSKNSPVRFIPEVIKEWVSNQLVSNG